MRLQSLLSCLPPTLLLVSLVFAVAAAPAEAESEQLTVLNPNNFKETIAKGVWCVCLRVRCTPPSRSLPLPLHRFIEYFSPYCGHCRKFLPTWTELVEEVQKKGDPGIYLAQVNCAVDGGAGLCSPGGRI